MKLHLSGQRCRGTVGASPVLTQSCCSLIGANWHRGAPLFLFIIRPSSPRKKRMGTNKRPGETGHGLRQSTAISLQHPNRRAALSAHYFLSD